MRRMTSSRLGSYIVKSYNISSLNAANYTERVIFRDNFSEFYPSPKILWTSQARDSLDNPSLMTIFASFRLGLLTSV